MEPTLDKPDTRSDTGTDARTDARTDTRTDALDTADVSTAPSTRRLAVVTGASTGIGYHLAQCCADHGMDLIIVADEPQIDAAAKSLHVETTCPRRPAWTS